jgi:hypothetical protein
MAVIKIGCRFSAKIYTTCQRTMPPLVHVNYNLQQLLIMSNSLQWMAIDGMFWGKINSILCIPSPFNCGNLNMSLGLSQHHLVLCNDFLWTCSHHKWPWICSVCRNPSQSYPYSWFITKFVEGTAYPSKAPEFNTGFELSSCYSIFSIFCVVCFVDLCLSVCPFSFGLVLSVLLRFMDSDYPFGILDLRLLITPLVS